MLDKACRAILTSSMGVRSDETVLIVTDNVLEGLGRQFFDIAHEYCKEAVLAVMRERASHGEEPPPLVAAAMAGADVVLLVTHKSLSHTKARKDACARGARIASMPKITPDILSRVSEADFDQIDKDCRVWCDMLTSAKKVRVVTDLGTDVSFSIDGRKGDPDTGIYRKSGDFGNIPSGEAYIAPVEGTANGTIVIDASMATVGLLEEPIRITVSDGIAVGIGGGNGARKLEESLSPFGDDARNIAEFAIGLNASAIITGNTLEDEKVKHTIHFALGDNSTFGGTVISDSHLDGILRNPTIYLDDKMVMDKGKWYLRQDIL